jgi:pimeloyl-ACP methyl ester carboxylesterase
MGLLLSSRNDSTHPYLNTIVAWSVTSLAPSATGLNAVVPIYINNGDEAWNNAAFQSRLVDPETVSTRHDYFHNLYFEDLADAGKLFSSSFSFAPEYIPPQPVMWYRDSDWQPCKTSSIAQSRFDRYEVYSGSLRHLATALDLELVYLSFPDTFGQGAISPYGGALNFTFPSPSPSSRLLLLAGDKDNYLSPFIYYSTQVMAAALTGSLGLVIPGSSASQQAYGKAEFWQNTGHSFHAERPQALAREIAYFINNLDAGNAYLSQGESRSGPPAWTVQGIVPTAAAPDDFPLFYTSSLIHDEAENNPDALWAIVGPVAPRSGFTDLFNFLGLGGVGCAAVRSQVSIWQDGVLADCGPFTD